MGTLRLSYVTVIAQAGSEVKEIGGGVGIPGVGARPLRKSRAAILTSETHYHFSLTSIGHGCSISGLSCR
jgi:hypothetical protein